MWLLNIKHNSMNILQKKNMKMEEEQQQKQKTDCE